MEEKLWVALLSVRHFLILLCLCQSYLALNLSEAGKLKFVVIGDTGGTSYPPYSTMYQRFLAQELARIPEVDFFMGVGDNFYYNGVKNIEDQRFMSTFELTYNYPSLYKDWYMIAGNHDYFGNLSAQILYSKISKRWNFPNYFYTKVFDIPNSNKTLQIILIDTICMCFAQNRNYKKLIPDVASSQMEWLTQTLENSTASHIIVSGHHPMYSGGWHGSSQCLQDKVEKLFEKHGVSAYFSGHDHTLQHIKNNNSRLEHIISGSGTSFRFQLSSVGSLEPHSLKFSETKNPGFVIVTANDTRLEVQFYVLKEQIKYRVFLKSRKELQDGTAELPKLLRDFFNSVNASGT